jgi:hypothetical protein
VRKVLLVGNPNEGHVGAHLRQAAESAGIALEFCDVWRAYEGPYLKRKWDWWVRGHRPAAINEFGAHVLELCERVNPAAVLVVGIAPPAAEVLRRIRSRGAACGNFLTDDPWNRRHHAPWFLRALPEYSHVFSPRRANLDELRRHAPASEISYLPFAYNPNEHFPAAEAGPAEMASDILFAGGADADRLPWIHSLIAAGWKLALYGGYWSRDAVTRPHARGFAGMAQLRRAVACAKVCLCLVRRANRDGHAMRSYELPAMGACLLVERTPEHEEIFGAPGENVLYFDSREELLAQASLLLRDEALRRSLAARGLNLLRRGPNTYADRLRQMTRAMVGEQFA